MCGVCFSGSAGAVDVELERIVLSVGKINNPAERIVKLSGYFIDTPYVANTLVGGPQVNERLVINLVEVDCFTLIDLIEALRRTFIVEDFPKNLMAVRYFDGKVTYAKRRHFFSDWIASGTGVVVDVTAEVGQEKTRQVSKQLNRRSDGTLWLPGIAVTPREIAYIPSELIDTRVLSALLPGDYVGIYSERPGLDVSHTGVLIKNNNNVKLRHASSRSGVEKVVDDELLEYLQGRAGLVVYRAKKK
jgi:hypothetical protein